MLGGGVAGLTAAWELARSGIQVEIIEKAPFPGGHAVQFACKALDACVSCGACLVEDRLAAALSHPLIRVSLNSRLAQVAASPRLTVEIRTNPQPIDPEKCSRCGICMDNCPHPGALASGFSGSHTPFITDRCAFRQDLPCTRCQELCPAEAVDLHRAGSVRRMEPDAILVATGFQAVDPAGKPYGYRRYPDVLTGLDLEHILKLRGDVRRPSDGSLPEKIAFIQCVGSRDQKQKRLWCSQVCCAAAIRQALLIKRKQPETRISLFYIDIQTFGSRFQTFYEGLRQQIDPVRAIPADVLRTDDNRLRLTFFESRAGKQLDETFDLVVLSVGMEPGPDSRDLAKRLRLELAASGFFPEDVPIDGPAGNGPFFTAGAVCGPMGIAAAAVHARQAAWKILRFLRV